MARVNVAVIEELLEEDLDINVIVSMDEYNYKLTSALPIHNKMRILRFPTFSFKWCLTMVYVGSWVHARPYSVDCTQILLLKIYNIMIF